MEAPWALAVNVIVPPLAEALASVPPPMLAASAVAIVDAVAPCPQYGAWVFAWKNHGGGWAESMVGGTASKSKTFH